MKRTVMIIGVCLLTGCTYLTHKNEIQNTLINRPDLEGLTEKELIDLYGLPSHIIPVRSDQSDETWVYQDRWYGSMNFRLIDGVVKDVTYFYGRLSR